MLVIEWPDRIKCNTRNVLHTFIFLKHGIFKVDFYFSYIIKVIIKGLDKHVYLVSDFQCISMKRWWKFVTHVTCNEPFGVKSTNIRVVSRWTISDFVQTWTQMFLYLCNDVLQNCSSKSSLVWSLLIEE